MQFNHSCSCTNTCSGKWEMKRPVTWLLMSASQPCTHRTQVTSDEYCPAASAEWMTAEQSSASASAHQTYTQLPVPRQDKTRRSITHGAKIISTAASVIMSIYVVYGLHKISPGQTQKPSPQLCNISTFCNKTNRIQLSYWHIFHLKRQSDLEHSGTEVEVTL